MGRRRSSTSGLSSFEISQIGLPCPEIEVAQDFLKPQVSPPPKRAAFGKQPVALHFLTPSAHQLGQFGLATASLQAFRHTPRAWVHVLVWALASHAYEPAMMKADPMSVSASRKVASRVRALIPTSRYGRHWDVSRQPSGANLCLWTPPVFYSARALPTDVGNDGFVQAPQLIRRAQ